jgi:hypothetical protein
MEANNYGCITEALTVAAMLSTESALLPGKRLGHLGVLHIFKLDLKSCSLKQKTRGYDIFHAHIFTLF